MYTFSFCRTALNTNLKIEREWRTSLQEESVKDKERIGAMQMELKQLEQLKKVQSVLCRRICSFWIDVILIEALSRYL